MTEFATAQRQVAGATRRGMVVIRRPSARGGAGSGGAADADILRQLA
jgi:hypothetical protein